MTVMRGNPGCELFSFMHLCDLQLQTLDFMHQGIFIPPLPAERLYQVEKNGAYNEYGCVDDMGF